MDEENNHNATHEVVKVNDPQVADKGPLLLWTLRILVRLKYFERFAERYSGFYNEELLQGIGLGEYYKADVESKEQRDKVFEKMRQHLFNLESSIGGQKDDVYGRNIEPLQSALNLSEADIEVLRFAVILGAA
ncbi:hypothetical protein, partial [Kaarinaea lacus]